MTYEYRVREVSRAEYDAAVIGAVRDRWTLVERTCDQGRNVLIFVERRPRLPTFFDQLGIRRPLVLRRLTDGGDE